MIRPEIHRVLRDELSLEPPAPDTDLIATGLLDSLSIVSLVVELERSFNLEISLNSIDLDAIRTIERLERLILDAHATSDGGPGGPDSMRIESTTSNLVNLKPGIGRPVFLLHTSHGGDLTPRAITGVIDTKRPTWGVLARGYNTSEEPQTCVEEMATTYVGALRAVQPQGPYTLVGYSFGGLIAYEMACQLEKIGHEVDTLAMIDVQAASRALSRWRRLRFSLSAPTRYVRYILEDPRVRIPLYAHALLARLRVAAPPQTPDEVGLTAQVARIRTNAIAAESKYAPRPYPGRVTLFAAQTREPGQADPRAIWSDLVGDGLTIQELPGDHHEIMQAHLDRVGRLLSGILAPV